MPDASNELDSDDKFIRRVLHDLKAPARHVRMFAQFLRESLDEATLDESSRESLDVIDRAAIQMQNTLESLGAFLRLPKQAGPPDAADVRRIVDHCWMAAQQDVDTADATLNIDGDATIATDATLLSQIIGEAFGNAIRFRKPDEPLRVTCAISQSDDRCRIDITDTGVGIDPKYVEKVIEPFERAPSKGVKVGAGLGLALCRRAAELLGGKLSLSSDGQSGTTFQLELPSAR